MNPRSIVLVLAATLTLTSCSTAESSGAAVRPKSISVTDVDPCSVFTRQQLQQFGMDPKPGDVTPPPIGQKDTSCIWSTPIDVLNLRPEESVYAEPVTFLGADEAFARSTDPKSWTTIQGYRAAEIDKSDGPRDMTYQLYIDINDKQSLNVAWFIHGWKDSEQAGKDQARQKAVEAANIAVTNLLAR